MRAIPAALQAHLRVQATTLSHCWRLTRKDGAVLGFTDHDEPLTFAGTRFEAATGFEAGEAEAMIGLAAGTQEVEGALSSAAIDEADVSAGRYDGATVEIFIADWQNPQDAHLLLDVADLGEVKRSGPAFAAELRGIASRLDRVRGRIYRRRCDAALGDERCRADLSILGRTVLTTVSGGDSETLQIATQPLGRPLSHFIGGSITVTAGAASGLSGEIASIAPSSDGTAIVIVPVEALRALIAAGDGVRLTVGCDKSFATCRGRFDNGLNFRGFPHLPGSDAALGFAKADGLHDGGPVVP
ncbi:DUF2163 domain-containing protein [Mangrovicella endophytica]|uniref:DUF2163 domain-containing protein n=1 Tax=Mangrovicella endophytica TaxID=2066697 RepID=UPI000C9E3163|nr:DUF2163 domain-containing protein [Mangrovicella endophytica]